MNRREWRKVKDKVDSSCKEDELPLSVWQGRRGIEENEARSPWMSPGTVPELEGITKSHIASEEHMDVFC